MAKNPKQNPSFHSKKHLARLERERIMRRYILIGAVVVLAAVIILVTYGFLSEGVLKNRQPVAIVNGESITTRDFQAQVRYARQGLVNYAVNNYQFIQFLGNDPNAQASFAGQLAQIQSQLNPVSVGQQALDDMGNNILIRQEANSRGITVTEEEIDQAIQEALGYFPNGTPTQQPTLEVLPTSTLSPLQRTLIPPTATPTLTSIPTATETATMTLPTSTVTSVPTTTPTTEPLPTPTEYTLEGYQQRYKETIDNLETNIQFTESDLRYALTSELYRQKLEEAVLDESGVSPVEDQVWARHILVADEDLANEILVRINNGEDWNALAAEFSTDTSNATRGGDLGWFGKGMMVPEFENAAFGLQVGEVVSSPVQTSFGWHIIQVLGHEERPLAEAAYTQLQQKKFEEFLQTLRDNADIEIRDYWIDRVPEEPTLPPEIVNFIQLAQQQSQPPITTPSP